MPYYIGAGTPEWDEYMETAEDGSDGPPVSMFTYVEPWQAGTTVLPFPATPGPEPELPQRTAYSSENWLENYRKAVKAASAHALWKVSGLTATCRALGVKRVFASYDGGGDESFTHHQGVEMSDGRVIPTSPALRTMADLLHGEPRGIDYDELVENAVSALMGTYDAGEFTLHGVVTIDFDACTITDEKNADVVFGGKMPWEA